MLPHEVLLCVAGITLAAIGLYLLPSCSEAECVASHKAHTLRAATNSAEQQHQTYHSPDRPQPLCALCQAKKRDEQ